MTTPPLRLPPRPQPRTEALRLAPVAALLLAACSDPGRADDAPAGPVIDEADILSSRQEAQLSSKLLQYRTDHGTEIVVNSTPSLDGRSIEQVAFESFSELGVGDPDTSRGLLILIVPDERKMRIEVGCGLESAITNATAAEVIKTKMIPFFRYGEYPEGILSGVDSLIAHLAQSENAGPTSLLCLQKAKQAE